jgi:hypothetical protein
MFYVALRKEKLVVTLQIEEISIKESEVEELLKNKFTNITDRYKSKIE